MSYNPYAATMSQPEYDFLAHMQRWGSSGYPVRKLSRGWLWDEFCGVKGAPVVYKTKRECVAAIEAYIHVLCDKAAGRA